MRLDEKTTALAGLALFRALEPEALHVLAFSATTQQLKAGEDLFRKGARADTGYVVVSGRIGVQATDGAPGEGEVVGPGGLIGVSALLVAGERPGTALALEPSRVLVLSQSLMRQGGGGGGTRPAALRAHLAGELASTRQRLAEII